MKTLPGEGFEKREKAKRKEKSKKSKKKRKKAKKKRNFSINSEKCGGSEGACRMKCAGSCEAAPSTTEGPSKMTMGKNSLTYVSYKKTENKQKC